MKNDYRKLISQISSALGDKERAGALSRAVRRGRDARKTQFSLMDDPAGFVAGIKEMKTGSAERMDELVEQFAARCRENGNSVFIAETGKDAVDYIVELSAGKGAALLSKSKSLTTEEIELNRRLEEKGLNVVETDLGERIIQLAGEKPYHLVFPAIHMSQRSIAELFTTKFGYAVADRLEDIMEAVRKELRPVFFGTDIGINGANIGVAETGTIVIETNEGNDRLVNSLPRVQVVVVGMEKIVPSWEDAVRLINAHPLSATGTQLTNYVSMISNRLDLKGGGAREMHVIILDNGRRKMRSDPGFREALNCIRCGACMNICPTYGVVGGHTFGHIYPGPIGIPWTEEVHGLENAKFSHLCISCGLCQTVCPAGIDIPMMIARVKERDNEANGRLLVDRFMCSTERMSKYLSLTAPVSNWVVGNRLSRRIAHSLLGLERSRSLPVYTRRSFTKLFRSSRSAGGGGERVVYFPDMFANYVRPEIGLGAAHILEAVGAAVVSPRELTSSGAPLFLYGELRRARKVAKHNVSVLHPLVSSGFEIVSTEPTATYSLKEIYPKLLDGSSESMEVAAGTHELFEYLASRHPDRRLLARDGEGADRIGFHIPCHERPLSSGRHAIAALRAAGYDVRVVETGTCCGMAGTFGLKKGALGADLSRAVARPLVDMFNAEEGLTAIATESSVCTMQIAEGVHVPVKHPVELLSA